MQALSEGWMVTPGSSARVSWVVTGNLRDGAVPLIPGPGAEDGRHETDQPTAPPPAPRPAWGRKARASNGRRWRGTGGNAWLRPPPLWALPIRRRRGEAGCR